MESKDILLVVDIVKNERDVAAEDVFDALEKALAIAAQKKFSDDIDIRVEIDRNSGEHATYRRWEIVDDDDENFKSPDKQMLLSAARRHDDSLNPGDYFERQIDNVPFGRISAHTAKQVIVQKLREAERLHIVSLYKDKVGTLVMGSAKHEDYNGLYVDLGNNAEGLIRRSELIPRENIRPGNRVRAYLKEVKEDLRGQLRGPQLIMSRTAPEFLVKLFELEVPEVSQGLIEIKGAARDPGLRAKIAVHSKDARLDPVGACVGMRGARVQAVSNELAGERVDIVPWDEDFGKYVINVMAPSVISSIVVDEEQHKIDIAVGEDKLSQVIGRGGQNVRLASQLLDWKLNVITTQQAADKSENEIQDTVKLFLEKLDVDKEVADILVDEGFENMEAIAFADDEKLLKIKEFDEQLVEDLKSRACDALLAAISEQSGNAKEHSSDELIDLESVDQAVLLKLLEHGIKNREELAEQAVDDLLAIGGISREKAADLIMEARIPWFQKDEND